MSPLRRLAPLCAGLLILAGCGGGATPAAPPTSPTSPVPGARMAAEPGSAQHNTVTWSGGSAGTAWRLERRLGDNGDYALVAEVDSGTGVWLDGGLSADTAYGYRLSRADGSVLATASVRTGSEAALTTPAPAPTGTGLALPVTPTTQRLELPDGGLTLDLPAGSLSQSGTATLQPIANPLADGIGPGLSLSLPERPARALTLSLRYGADKDADEVLQDRIALRQADGSWWLLPLAAFDEGRRLLQVSLPPSVWVAGPTATALAARPGAVVTAGGVRGDFVRVKALKLVPASATVPTLRSQRFVPVSIYRLNVSTGCESDDGLCVPSPVLRDVQLPLLNSKPGFQRQWTLEGSATPDGALGTLAPDPQAGVVYTAPAQVPATHPLTLRFLSTDSRSGRHLVLSARVRVAEDAWVGQLQARVGVGEAGNHYAADTRWTPDAAQSSATRRVYRPSGNVAVRIESPCAQTASPDHVTLAQARATGQLVIDESTSPARYALALNTLWYATIQLQCTQASFETALGHVWAAEGVVQGGQIQGADDGLGARSWSLGRPQ